MLILLFGRSPSLDNTCSQVFTMRLVDPCVLFILEAVFVVCKPYVYRTEPSEADFLIFSWIALL